MAQYFTDNRHLAPTEGFVELPDGAWQCTNCDEGRKLSGWRDHLYNQSKDRPYDPEPGEKYLAIDLTSKEFTALLESHNTYDPNSDKIILAGERTTAGFKISGWEGDIDNFIGFVAENANHTEKKRVKKYLDAVCGEIQNEVDDCFESSVLR